MTYLALRESPLTASLILFSYFQLLDLLTTVGFIMRGVQEANPIVRFAFIMAPTPLVGLILVKALAMGMAFYCWRQGRTKLLGRMNVLFAALISWNMLALILGSV
jgi:hypothetical protein